MNKMINQSIEQTPTAYYNLIMSATRRGAVLQADEDLFAAIGMDKDTFTKEFNNNVYEFIEEGQKDEFVNAMESRSRAVFDLVNISKEDGVQWQLLLGLPCEHKDYTKAINATLLRHNRKSNRRERYREVNEVKECIDDKYGETYDSITGLPCELKFYKEVQKIMQQEPNKSYAIVYTDVDSFGYVNEAYGFFNGNRLLAKFAALLKAETQFIKVATRLSADNFVMLIANESAKQDTNDTGIYDRISQKVISLCDTFSKLCYEELLSVKLTLSSGIAFVGNQLSIRTVIDNANVARKSVKGKNLTSCAVFNKEMQVRLQWETYVNQHMEEALTNHEFTVYYQPKVSLESGKIVGAEALVRWINAEGDFITPNRFIPIFEKNGFIERLDFFVYEEVCSMLRERLDKQLPVVPVSVNVSGVHLVNPYFVQHVTAVVEGYAIPTSLIELELTESVCIENSKEAIEIVKKFRDRGFVVSMDDFGSGYSSLNLLKDMEMDVIKLDRQFFREGEMHREEQIIIASIVHMAKQLNMKVLSEGVETLAQSEFLKEISCDMAQGYFFAKPMEARKFITMLEEQI